MSRDFDLERRRRSEWIEANGPCQACGSTEDLEVDHVDWRTKTIEVSRNAWSRAKHAATKGSPVRKWGPYGQA